MFRVCVYLLLVLCMYCEVSLSARILMIPVPMRSHFSCMTSMAVELSKRGHQIDIFFTDGFRAPSGVESPSIGYITYPADAANKDMDSVIDGITRDAFAYNGNVMRVLQNLTAIADSFCDRLIMDNEAALLNLESKHYDIVIVDNMLMMKCAYFIPHRLRIPIITMADAMEYWTVKLPWFPSVVPLEMLPYSDRMSFTERLINSFMFLAMPLIPLGCSISDEMIKKYSQYGQVETIDDVIEGTTLWLYTHDDTLDYPSPSMPNVLPVGGLATKPARELSSELESVITEWSNGFILVSFGSGVSYLEPKQSTALLDTFSRLDLLVFWRFTNVDGLEIPGNVMLMDWLPQNDLLGHKKIKLFVTHGGKNGAFEAVYHGVPMVVLPIHSDQPHNAKKIVAKGFGEAADIFNIAADDVYSKITRVLSNPSYAMNITKASRIFHSRTGTPAERAVDGIEHVLQFGGDHMRSAAFGMPWYQYWMLDVIGTAVVVISLLAYLAIKSTFVLYNKCLKSSMKNKQA